MDKRHNITIKKKTIKLIDDILNYYQNKEDISQCEYNFYSLNEHLSFIKHSSQCMTPINALMEDNYFGIESKLNIEDISVLFNILKIIFNKDYKLTFSKHIKNKIIKYDDYYDGLDNEKPNYNNDETSWINYFHNYYNLDIKITEHIPIVLNNKKQIYVKIYEINENMKIKNGKVFF